MDKFIGKIEKEMNAVLKLRDSLIGSLALDEAIKFTTYLAYIRKLEAAARATYQAELWSKLQEEDMTFSKAEAYAKAQNAYAEYLRLSGLADSIVDLGHALRAKGRGDDKEFQATV